VITTVFSSLISIIGISVVLLGHRPYLLILALITVIPTTIFKTFFAKLDYANDVQTRLTQRQKNYYGAVLVDPRIAKELRLYGAQPFFFELWERQFKKMADLARKFYRKTNWMGVLVSILSWSCFTVFTGFMAFDAWHGLITLGAFTMYAANLGMLDNNITNIADSMRQLFVQRKRYGEFDKFINQTPDQRDLGEGAMDLSDGVSIRFDDVSFSYDGMSYDVLSHISFEIASGEKITISASLPTVKFPLCFKPNNAAGLAVTLIKASLRLILLLFMA
jgi:ABC-type bacteriocin/lantibiotic exporter with double-glycine peptidase domain